MLIYETTLLTLGSAQAVAGAEVAVTNFLILYDVAKTNENYPEGWDGASIHFSLALSSGSSDSSVDIALYTVLDGATADTVYNQLGSPDGSTLSEILPVKTQLAIAMLTQDGTSTFTLNVETKNVGPVVKIGLIRSAGDRTIAVTTKARRWRRTAA